MSIRKIRLNRMDEIKLPRIRERTRADRLDLVVAMIPNGNEWNHRLMYIQKHQNYIRQ